MSTKVEKLEKNMVELEIEVSAEDFEKAMVASYKKNVKAFNIPGFRKGHAPRKFIEKMYGPEIFYDDAINACFPDAYEAAVAEAKIEPIDRPEVDIKQLPGEGTNLILTAKVAVKPSVRMAKFETVDIKKPVNEVDPAEVDNEIKVMQERNARIITIEDRPAENGDTVVIDFEGFVDGVAFEGGKGDNYNLTLGSGQFIPGFEEQLVGKNTGDEVEVNVEFPAEYHAEELAGKPAMFKVKIHSIKAKELSELDDEFAKDVSEFDTLDELKADILAKLTKRAEEKTKQETETAAIKFAVEKMKVDIPEVMYENRIDELVRDFEMRLSYQGLALDKYLEYTGLTIEAIRAQFREQAEEQVKGMLALEAIGKREKIKATKEDVAAEFDKMAEEYKMDVKEIKNVVNEEDLKKDIITRKTIDFLVSIVNYID